MKWAQKQKGFTIVELLIVVVVIAILAAITIVAYNGISTQAKESALKADLKNASTQLHIIKTKTGAFPDTASELKKSEGTVFSYSGDVDGMFCISASNNESLPGRSFFVDESGSIEEGECSPATLYMQTITSSSCPTDRTLAVDARDNHTYWLQQLADGECWMLTNLAYAGGTDNDGSDTHGDVKAIQNGTGDGSRIFTQPKYYIHSSANPTTDPAEPSTSIDGGVTNTQYGYLYNWCAAMGGQTSTSACANATTPAPDPSLSICPAGWRLPTVSELQYFTNSINATSNTAGSTNLRTLWLAQMSGGWYGTFSGGGADGRYWSSSQYSSNSANYLYFTNSNVSPTNYNDKQNGFPVRCILA